MSITVTPVSGTVPAVLPATPVQDSTTRTPSRPANTTVPQDSTSISTSGVLRQEMTELTDSIRSATEGIVVSQSALGVTSSAINLLDQLRILVAGNAAVGAVGPNLDGIKSQVKAVRSELDEVARNAKFKHMNLADGTFDAHRSGLTHPASTALSAIKGMDLRSDALLSTPRDQVPSVDDVDQARKKTAEYAQAIGAAQGMLAQVAHDQAEAVSRLSVPTPSPAPAPSASPTPEKYMSGLPTVTRTL